MNLRVRDAVACRDFYERHFGFKPTFEADGGYFVRNDDGFLLALVPADPHTALPEGFHIGFNGTNADEVLRTSRGAVGGRREDRRRRGLQTRRGLRHVPLLGSRRHRDRDLLGALSVIRDRSRS